MRRKPTSSLFALLMLLWILPTSASCQDKQRRPSRYLVPEGYVGWVKVYFKVKDAPALPIEDGYYLFTFPPSGILKTSSEMEEGYAQDEYFYYSGDTRRKLASTGWDGGGMIWAGHTGQSGSAPADANPSSDVSLENKSFYEAFFIGTEAEYEDYGRYMSEEVGPIDKDAIKEKKIKMGIP